MKIAVIQWPNQVLSWQAAAPLAQVTVHALTLRQLKADPEASLDQWRRFVAAADVALIYKTPDDFDERFQAVAQAAGIPTLYLASDPHIWAESTVDPRWAAEAYRYSLLGGTENMRRLALFLRARLGNEDGEVLPPEEQPWQFGWHPDVGIITDVAELWAHVTERGFDRYIGLLMSRSVLISGNHAVEVALIQAFEAAGIGVVPVAYHPIVDHTLGNWSGAEVITTFFAPQGTAAVEAVVMLPSFGLGKGAHEAGHTVLQRLNIPLISPVLDYRQRASEWLANPQGLGSQVTFSIAMPELDGAIEPLVIGALNDDPSDAADTYQPLPERLHKLVRRTARWLELRRKPARDKKIAIVLHNNPCVGAESSVGGGAHLDTLESVAQVLAKLAEAGYRVRVPKDGNALIEEILSKKALSEFRFTAAEDIVKSGGALALLEPDLYRDWFAQLPESVRHRIINAWGQPPGERQHHLPPAMLYDGKLIISAVEFGNAVVLVQPKRGCAGSRCDGEVCLILHDPDVPPPHHYIATYQWLQRVFGADLLLHVGTHGNLEFLPGKSTGMSDRCFSDIGVGDLPHLYIYNADNPAEGIIAKRRSYAVTVNHMQTALSSAGLYGDLLELDRLIDEYQRLKDVEPGKAHTVQHLIMEHPAVAKVQGDGVRLTHETFDQQLMQLHGQLATLQGTYIPQGMHVFGRVPHGKRLAKLVYATVRWGLDAGTLRGTVAQLLGIDPAVCDERDLLRVDALAKAATMAWLIDRTPLADTLARTVSLTETARATLAVLSAQMDELAATIQETDEIGSLQSGLNGGFIAPGPSGLITRGHPDILPTGRNLYGIDPWACPSRAAWAIGQRLADGLLERHRTETGHWPQTIGFYWQCTDLMWSNGEMYGQLLHLLGCEPIWDHGGHVQRFRIVPLEVLNRPRIDLTVRISGITRDNFPHTIALLDQAVTAVADLDEPEYLNFVRKHTLEQQQQGLDRRAATARLFGSPPGTYQAGTNLAIYASAWQTPADLTDIYLFWNSFAYGHERFGERQVDAFKANLRTVEATFNKTVSDEYDLTGCCCYFGTHGGFINAAKTLREGAEVRNYYGDTREQGRVGIRPLADEMRRVVRAKLLNPQWIEGMKEHGYKGAGDISKRVGRVYGWQATSHEVDGGLFDDIARTFLMDEANRQFFEATNPWALEEIGRRLLEAQARGLWTPAADVAAELQERYLDVEGWLEERMGEGEVQGGRIDIKTAADVTHWQQQLQAVLG